jgi:hypothetical protein
LGSYLSGYDDFTNAIEVTLTNPTPELINAVWHTLPIQGVVQWERTEGAPSSVLICRHQSCSLPLKTATEIENALKELN